MERATKASNYDKVREPSGVFSPRLLSHPCGLLSMVLSGPRSDRRKKCKASAHPLNKNCALASVQFRDEQFSARSRKSRNYAEAYKGYAAQVIPKIDAEIAEKGHFWMNTS